MFSEVFLVCIYSVLTFSNQAPLCLLGSDLHSWTLQPPRHKSTQLLIPIAMQFTPVIPPYPSPQGGSSPGHPPVIPMFSPNHPPTTPAWAQPHQFPTHSPYAGTQPTVPGSYFIPPIQLPPQQAPNTPVAPVGSGGFSADWTGYPSSGASPFVHPTASPPALHPRTPYVAAVPPGTAYTMFQQPLPGGFGPSPGQGPPMWMPMHAYTPFAMPGVMPGVWPSTPYPPAAPGGLPPQAPQPAQQQAPAPAPAPPVLRLQDVVELSKIDKFAEGPHCTLTRRFAARPAPANGSDMQMALCSIHC